MNEQVKRKKRVAKLNNVLGEGYGSRFDAASPETPQEAPG
jgi:hypothetical protein